MSKTQIDVTKVIAAQRQAQAERAAAERAAIVRRVHEAAKNSETK